MTIDPVISVSLRCLLSAVFAAAAWHKATDMPRFRATFAEYRVLPAGVGHVVAGLVPGLELALSVGLLLPIYPFAAWGALSMLCIYTAAIALNLVRGRRDFDCGCFGPGSRVSLSAALLVRNGLLIVGGAAILVPLASRSLLWVDALTVASVVTGTSLLWVSFWRLRQIGASRGGFS